MPKVVNKILLFLLSSLASVFVGSALSVFVTHLYYPEEKIKWNQVPHDIWESFVWAPFGMLLAPFEPFERFGDISIVLVPLGLTAFVIFTCLFFIRSRLVFLLSLCVGLVLWNIKNHQIIGAIFSR